MNRLCFCVLIFSMGVALATPTTSLSEKEKDHPLRDNRATLLQQPGADARAEDVKGLLELLQKRKFKELEEAAHRLMEAAPSEARFHYLRAEALAALGKEKEADALREHALQLNPENETPHALAGDMLYDLERSAWAKRELQKVLDLPPATGLNEANAHIELGCIYAKEKRSSEAANHLEMALDLYRNAKAAGLSLELDGAKEEDLEAKIRELRGQKGETKGAMSISVTVSVKDGKGKEMAQALKGVCCRVDMSVEPCEIRVLDMAEWKIRYNPKTDQLLLNEKPFCDAQLKLRPKETRIAIFANDCCYIYQIDRENGRMDKIARYERDYTLTLTPGPKLNELKNVSVKLNGLSYNWKHLQEGVPFDILPSALKLELQGTNAANQRIQVNITIPVPFKQSELPIECPGCEKCRPDLYKSKPNPQPGPTPSAPLAPERCKDGSITL